MTHLKWLAIVIVSLVLCCTKPPPKPVSSLNVDTGKTNEIALGIIQTMTPPVTFRRNRDLVWNDASPGTSLFPFDAIQTETKAETRVVLKNGSELQIRENSLVILSPDLSERLIDRAVVKNGSLKGKTKKELWLSTNGTILRMKPKRSESEAVLQLDVGEKALSIKTENAVAILNHDARKAETIIEGQETTVLLEGENRSEHEPVWVKELAPIEVAKVSEPQRKVASIPKSTELTVISPKNNLETTEPTIPVEGSLSQKGGKVWVNGEFAQLDERLHFQVPVALNYGANVILIQVSTHEGTSSFRRFTVVRRKP